MNVELIEALQLGVEQNNNEDGVGNGSNSQSGYLTSICILTNHQVKLDTSDPDLLIPRTDSRVSGWAAWAQPPCNCLVASLHFGLARMR